MTTDEIKAIFSQFRALQGEAAAFRACSLRENDDAVPPVLRKKIAVIEAWMYLLTDEEWYVITKHLIDRLSWARVMLDHEKRWGKEQARHERTLKRRQACAIDKIKMCVENNNHAAEIRGLFW